MKTLRRAPRVLGMTGAGAALLLLAGCNPESAKPTINPSWAVAMFQYDGPADAWFEAAVSDAPGRVDILGAVHVPDYLTNSEQRQCRDGVHREVIEPCSDYREFPNTDRRRVDLDAPGSYWPMVLLHPGDQFQVIVYCLQDGTTTTCPATTTVHVQTVDVSGELVGDIKPITKWGPA